MNEEEYNDEKDYANLVPYGIPMYFYLMNTSDNDWFKILDTPDSKGPYHEVTISVEFTGASSLTQTNEARICKYSLYDSNMQLWGAGSFHFSKSQPVATTTRTVPIGPLYLKVYFDPSYNYGLLPNDSLILRMEAGKDAIQGY